ncbi:MAG: MBL fold metallo-hydrolase [Hydrogenophilales bacterium 28-61-23]|nr:MAG: MBL fold metallo-hydrolase [Hydrogenophilales bacterium 28-61-23]
MPLFAFLIAALLALPGLAHADFQPKAEKVVDNVYAIVGPLGQRSKDNDGSNANFGFIVTAQGVILIDSGASRLGAEKIAAAIAQVTDQPVRWVINTGSQDHRWLGNDYFAAKGSTQGARIFALKRTAATQAEFGAQHMQMLAGFLGARLDGTQPLPATTLLDGNEASVELGGETLTLRYTDAHFPGDAWVWLPKRNIMFTGDLVYVDRILGVLPWSSVKNGQKAFHALEALSPKYIVPGHGGVCDLAKAKRDSGDYEDFLANVIGKAARDMEPLDATLNKYADLPQFKHLYNFSDLHRANMSRAFVEFEAN